MVPHVGWHKPCQRHSASCNIPSVNTTEKAPRAGPTAVPEVYLPDVTVAALVLDAGRLLLVEEDVRGEVVVNQPAGHLEPEESLADAMVRECLEETGWSVEPTGLVGIYQWIDPDTRRQYLRVAFAARALKHNPEAPLDAGIVQPLWLTPDQLRECRHRHRSPLVMRAAQDFLDGRSFPLSAANWLA
jgi:8-oxo-dGTP pyrophosphatase MutT (NUDIX family)